MARKFSVGNTVKMMSVGSPLMTIVGDTPYCGTKYFVQWFDVEHGEIRDGVVEECAISKVVT